MIKIYLAGPEVFLPNAAEVLKEKKQLVQKMGFLALTPFDAEVDLQIKGIEKANSIFLENQKLIDDCDMVVVNCNAFRGACMDDGSAWEIGYAFALHKKIYGFIDQKKDLVTRSLERIKTTKHSSGYFIDEQGYLLNEDFGNSINLMMQSSIEKSGGSLVQGDFQTCLEKVRSDVLASKDKR